MSSSAAPRLESFIGGKFEPSGGPFHDDINPSDRSDVIARIPAGTPEDAARAARAAENAFESWRERPGPQRAEALGRWADAIHARRDEMASAMSREVGKPITEARGEVARCTTILRYYAGEAVRAVGDVIPAQSAGALQFTLREPLGVVALITPWNFPLAIPLWKAAPALAFGNTVVLKPAEASSKVASLLAETALAAELPAGRLQRAARLRRGRRRGAPRGTRRPRRELHRLRSGRRGHRRGRGGAQHPISDRDGRQERRDRRRDADLDLAASLTAAGAMRYAGQKCTATSRAVVSRKIEQAFLAKLREQIEALPLGPVDDPAAAIGPLISEEAHASIREALARAGREIWGGEVPDDARFGKGFFCAPALVRSPNPIPKLPARSSSVRSSRRLPPAISRRPSRSRTAPATD